MEKNNKSQPKKSTKHRPKFGPKSTKNRFKICPKWVQNQLWSRRRFGVRFCTDFGPIFGPTWGHLGGQVGAMLGKKIDFWRFPKACKNDHDFQHPSGPSWDRFWDDFGIQNRTKIGPRSVSRAIIAQKHASSFRPTKTNGFCTFFIPQEVKNRQKIVLKVILS